VNLFRLTDLSPYQIHYSGQLNARFW